MTPTLRVKIPSSYRPGFVHQPGTEVLVVEAVDPDQQYWIVEARVPDDALEGGAWFEALEVELDQLDFSCELQQDMAEAKRSFDLTASAQRLARDIETAIRTGDKPGTRRIPREELRAA